MKSNYQKQLFVSKNIFHKSQANKSYEEKFKIIIQLQKLSLEMQNRNPRRADTGKMKCVWQLEDN